MWRLFIIVFAHMLVSCVDTFEFSLPTHQNMPVLTSIMQANQQIRVYFGSTGEVEDTILDFIGGTDIFILDEETGMIDTLLEEGQGWYISSFIAQPLTTYQIETWYDGKKVWGRDQIPAKGRLVDWEYSFIVTGDPSGDDFHNITIRLENDDQIAEYYEFSFINQACLPDEPDRCFIDYYLFGKNVDPKIKAEGILEFDPPYYVLSDEMFQGPNTTIFFQLVNGKTRGGNDIQRVDNLLEGDLLHINYSSRSYYLFKKSLLQYRHGINTDEQLDDFQKFFFGTNPKPLFTNVNNGLGVVAGVYKEYVEVFE